MIDEQRNAIHTEKTEEMKEKTENMSYKSPVKCDFPTIVF